MARKVISDTLGGGAQIISLNGVGSTVISNLDGNAAIAYDFTGSGYISSVGANRHYAYLQIPGLSTGNYVTYTRRFYGQTANTVGTADTIAVPTWGIMLGLVDFAAGDGYLNFKGTWSTLLVGGRMPYQSTSAFVVNTANYVQRGDMTGAYIAPNANNITSLTFALATDPGGAGGALFSGFTLKVEPLFSH